jgi:transketolase
MDGHSFENIRETFESVRSSLGKGTPIVILMKTEMGKGVDYMMGSHKWHGIAPNSEQLQIALDQLEETIGDY